MLRFGHSIPVWPVFDELHCGHVVVIIKTIIEVWAQTLSVTISIVGALHLLKKVV